jgi:protein-disulfide isomerase
MIPHLEIHHKKSIFHDYPWFIFIFGIIFGVAVFSSINYLRLSRPKNDILPEQPVKFNISHLDYIWGNREAKIQLVVYSDFSCEYCREYFNEIKQFSTDHFDKLAVVWRHFPLNKKSESANAANAAECAGAQGKFWEMAELIYNNQENLSLNFYYNQAEEIGLEKEKFKRCLDSREFQAKIDSQYAEGIAKGVEGTPTSFLNGRRLLGALPYYDLSQLIEPLIQ